jgi:hypothetical protein
MANALRVFLTRSNIASSNKRESMRSLFLAMICASGLIAAATSAQAAQIPQSSGTNSSNIVQVAGGCGPGFHPVPGHWSRWHEWVRPIAPRTAMVTQLRTIVTVQVTLTQDTRTDTVAIIGPATEEGGKRRHRIG